MTPSRQPAHARLLRSDATHLPSRATPQSPRNPAIAWSTTLAFATTILLAACGDASTSNGAATGLNGPDATLTAVTEDVFTIGALDGEDWETFGDVRGVWFDANGALHVFDADARRFVVVGPSGEFVRTVGQQGEGPGEIGNAMSATLFPDGRMAVFEFGLPGAFELFGPDGTWLEAATVDITKGVPGQRLVPMPDGRLLTAGAGRIRIAGRGSDPGDDEADEPAENRRPLDLFSLDGNDPETLYQAWDLPPAGEGETTNLEDSGGRARMSLQMNRMRAFEPGLHFGVLSDGRVAVADSIGWRVKLLASDGSVVGSIERPINPVQVTASIEDAERARRAAELEEGGGTRIQFVGPGPGGDMSSALRETMMRGLEEMIFADEIPVIADLAVDLEDRIWIARSGPLGQDDGPTDIATPDGDYVGTLPADGLRIPDAFGPGGLMAYMESDELGVESVRVVRLVSLER